MTSDQEPAQREAEGYIHGFSETERKRLWHQAEFAEQSVYAQVDFFECENVLEVGSGVGAQSAILLRRFPGIHLHGVDRSPSQIAEAKANLESLPYTKGRYEISQMDACNLDFRSRSFDGAFLCWVLEHVKHPERILSEVRRVLRPGAVIYVTEVMNSSFFLDPYSPHLWKYWMAFNDYQYERYGDPFIGAKLGQLLLSQGFQRIETKVIVWHYDNRNPDRRRRAIRLWRDLMLSATDTLLEEGYVTLETVNGMKAELETVESDPNAVFFYDFMQARAFV